MKRNNLSKDMICTPKSEKEYITNFEITLIILEFGVLSSANPRMQQFSNRAFTNAFS